MQLGRRILAGAIVLGCLATGEISAQVLSEQQLDYLRQLFIESVAESVDGSFIEVNTMPPNRIQGIIPSSKVQTDTAVLGVATNAEALAESADLSASNALVTALSASNLAVTAQSSADAVSNRVNVLEARTNDWNQAATDAADWAASEAAGATYTAELVFEMATYTTTLYIADGIITNAVQEGP